MGQITDARIAGWQEMAGIKPAIGDYARLLRALSDACFEAIKIIELEHSGIRDDIGDPIADMAHGLIGLCKELMKPREEQILED